MKNLSLFTILILIYLSSSFVEFQDPLIHPETLGKKPKLEIVQPHVYGGDEPHYILMVNSLVDDFDLDLKNNYYDLEFPSKNRTNLYRFRNIGLSTFKEYFVINNKIIYWTGTMDTILIKDKNGWTFTKYAKELSIDKAKLIPMTSPFLSLFLFPVLIPFASFKNLIEPLTIIFSVIIALIGLFFLYKILFRLNNRYAFFITLCFALATPLWTYSQTYYTEAYLWSLLLMSFYFFVIKDKNLLSGLFIALGFLIKETFLITIIPYMMYKLYKRKYKETIYLIIPLLVAFIIRSFYYYLTFTNPFYNPVKFIYGDIFKGIFMLFFDLRWGLLFSSPFLIFSFLGFYSFYKNYKKETIISLMLFLSHLILFASFIGTLSQGMHYSARYLIVVLPLLAFSSLPKAVRY